MLYADGNMKRDVSWMPEGVCCGVGLRELGTAGCLLLCRDPLMAIVSRPRPADAYTSIDTSAIVGVGYLFLCAICCVSYVRRRHTGISTVFTRPPLLFLSVYMVMCVFSVAWSPSWIYTGYRALEATTYLILIVVVLTILWERASAQHVAEAIVLWSVWVAAWQMASMVRALGIGALLSGRVLIAGHFATASTSIIALFISRRSLVRIAVVLLAVFSGASVVYVGLACALPVALAIGDRISRRRLITLVFCELLAIGIGGPMILERTLFYGQGGIGWEHMSGRGEIWTVALKKGMERPLFGYGFAAGELEVLTEEMGVYVMASHNVLASSLLSIGVLGPVLMLGLFASAFGLVLRRIRPGRWRSGLGGAIVMVFCLSLASPGLGGRVFASWIPVVGVLTFCSIVVCCRTDLAGAR